MTVCEHQNFRTLAEFAYCGSVAVYPYTDENRAAHGNITETQECVDCGVTRLANVNMRHVEFSPWSGLTFIEQREAERERRIAAQKKIERVRDLKKQILAAYRRYDAGSHIGETRRFPWALERVAVMQEECAEEYLVVLMPWSLRDSEVIIGKGATMIESLENALLPSQRVVVVQALL